MNSLLPLAAGIHDTPPPPPEDGDGGLWSDAGPVGAAAQLRYATSFRFKAPNHIPVDFNRLPWKEVPIIVLPEYPDKNVEFLVETFKERMENATEEERWRFLDIPNIREIIRKIFQELQI